MIRRPPTAITLQQSEVEELKAERIAQGGDEESTTRGEDTTHEHHQLDDSRQQSDTGLRSGTVSGREGTAYDQGQGEAEHPADQQARERQQMSRRERIGII